MAAKDEKKKPKGDKKEKASPESFIAVNEVEDWFTQADLSNFWNNSSYRILLFYVIHSPCKKASYARIDLVKYGWNNPWYYEEFRTAFDEKANYKKDKNFIYVTAQKDFRKAWESSSYADFSLNNITEEFSVFCYAGESNPRLDLLHHIRNALAHGRFAAQAAPKGKDFYIYMEDVIDSEGFCCVVARILLKRSTLIKWIDLFECKKPDAIKLRQSLLNKKGIAPAQTGESESSGTQ